MSDTQSPQDPSHGVRETWMYQIRPRRAPGVPRPCTRNTRRGFCLQIRPTFLLRAPVMVMGTWLVVLIFLTFGGGAMKWLQERYTHGQPCGPETRPGGHERVGRDMITGQPVCPT